jgi:hypothetical protein
MAESTELQKARQQAMLAAMARMRSGCEVNSGELLEKALADNRRFGQEIQDLREAGQKMLDQLSAYMSHDSLKGFAQALRLDTRIFTIPGEFDTYRELPYPVEDGAITRKDLEQVTAERDIAKMKLAVVTRELEELRSERQQQQGQHGASQQQQRVPKLKPSASVGPAAVKEKSACAVDCSKLGAGSFAAADEVVGSAACLSWRNNSIKAGRAGAAGSGSMAGRLLSRDRSAQLVLSRELEFPLPASCS